MSVAMVSICLPTYNSREFLEQRMQSILAQTFEDWELIVCDSFSDDGTWEYFQSFLDDPRIRLYQIPRDGLYPGWNQCLSKVRGKYCYIATSDDTMDPDFLKKMLALLAAAPAARVATCNFDFINTKDQIIPPTQGIAGSFFGDWQEVPHLRSGLLDFLVHTELSISWTTMTSVLFESSLIDEVGCFRVDASFSADRFWAMAVALVADTAHRPERLATWRIHSRQASVRAPRGWRQRNLELTRETLLNLLPNLKERFGDRSDLIDWLLLGVRRYYEESFCLDRRYLKHSPWLFAVGFLRAAVCQPEFLLRRIRQGFRWEEEIEVTTRKLLDRLALPWPPREIGIETTPKAASSRST